jgi:hypothetical protein
MTVQVLLPAFFFLIAMIYGVFWLTARLGVRTSSPPARRTHLRTALIFAAVSIWLMFWL